MGHFEQVEEAWSLSEAAREHAGKAGRELSATDYIEFFAQSPLVDIERSRRDGGQPLQRVYLKSPYGLQWREQHKDWIPFRHGEIDLDKV